VVVVVVGEEKELPYDKAGLDRSEFAEDALTSALMGSHYGAPVAVKANGE
jgi:hypothetical protein